MARARNIKPSFFQNEELGELSPIARLAFIAMWTIADFRGCIEFRPKRLKIQLLPYDECDIDEIATNLDKSGLIRIYSVSGQRYIKIVNFQKHQNPHKNERDAGSAIPDFEEKYREINGLQNIENNPERYGSDPADSLFPLPSSGTPITVSPSPIPEVVATPSAAAKKPAKIIDPEKQQACKATWQAYADAYFNRYGAEPVRNAKVNGQIVNIVERLGYQESPAVAAFFVSHQNSFYVRDMHTVGILQKDCEKLRTEWATNTRMTQTKALQADKTASNFDAFAPLIAAAKAKEEQERMNNAE